MEVLTDRAELSLPENWVTVSSASSGATAEVLPVGRGRPREQRAMHLSLRELIIHQLKVYLEWNTGDFKHKGTLLLKATDDFCW